MIGDSLSHALASQMLACIYTLKDCIDRCPPNEWHEKHNDYPFSQVVFHTLFDCDFCLCDDKEQLKKQDFHIKNSLIFADYEELEDKPKTHLYEINFINDYYAHCVHKIKEVIKSKTNDELLVQNSDIYKNMTKAERLINAIRHTQHHAAQLGLRLQYLSGTEMAWISRGYQKQDS
jgi:hypothetical protein